MHLPDFVNPPSPHPSHQKKKERKRNEDRGCRLGFFDYEFLITAVLVYFVLCVEN